MFKKLSASIFALALVAGVFAPAQAQDTIGIFFDDGVGGGLSRFGTTGAAPFNIAVFTATDEPSSAAEFVITELRVLFPGVFALATTKINNTPLDLGKNEVGEYLMAYAGCVPAGVAEIVRVQYGDFSGLIGNDVILQIRGFQPGDSQGSTFGGEMGYIDCNDTGHLLSPEPWPSDTNIDPTKGPNGVASGDGVCVLNADTVPNELDSVSSLKARF
jgi:hypothetical protein